MTESDDEDLGYLLPKPDKWWMWRRPMFVLATSLLIGCAVALAYVIWWMP